MLGVFYLIAIKPRFSSGTIIRCMKTKLTRAIEGLLGAKTTPPGAAVEVLDAVIDDLTTSRRDISAQQKKVKDAIESGTRIAKRRIPL